MRTSDPSLEERFSRLGLIGRSRPMLEFYDLLARFAPSSATILITGEAGSGKDLAARACHALSDRDGRLVSVNCAAVSESLFASEMFGHKKGAFTGATSDKGGFFKLADGGTLFLDEVATLCPENQQKLLRAIQEGEIQMVGADEPIQVDVRVIAATNADLWQAVSEGRFRSDLLDRLAFLPLRVPPLRERGDDILLLADEFLKSIALEENGPVRRMDEGFRQEVQRHRWPGNVRELQIIITRAIVLAPQDEELLTAEFFRRAMGMSPCIGSETLDDSAKNVPSSHDVIADLVFDALLAGEIPLAGLGRGHHELGTLSREIVEGVDQGFRKYLESEEGEKAFVNLASGALLQKLGLRRPGNESSFRKAIREVANRALQDKSAAHDAE